MSQWDHRSYGNPQNSFGNPQNRPPQPRYLPEWQQQPQQGYQPPPQYQQQPQGPRRARRRLNRRGRVFVYGSLGLLAVVIALIALSPSRPGATYKAAAGGFTVINPGDVAVAVHVTNTGNAAAVPACTVSVSDPAGSYTGFDKATLTAPVQPGQTVTYVDNVSVSHNGAQYVTQASVSC